MKTNFLRKSAIAVLTLTTASFYFAQEEKQGSEKNIDEVVLVGVADIAKDRKTPVAVSTVKSAQIIERLGNQELTEVLNLIHANIFKTRKVKKGIKQHRAVSC